MPIAFNAIEKVGGYSWRYGWAATAGPYRVYYQGRLLDEITDTEYTIREDGYEDEPPVLEVLDANDTDPADMLTHPPRVRLQWLAVDGAEEYRLYRYESTAWVHRATVKESGKGYYQHETDVVSDETLDEWAVYAITDLANDSYPVEVSAFVVRNPDAPSVTMTYDQDNDEIDIASA